MGRIPTLALLIVASCPSCKHGSSTPPAGSVTAKQEFELVPGQAVAVSGAGNVTRVRVVDVGPDTRCLLGDECPSNTLGTVSVRVEVEAGGTTSPLSFSFISRGAPEMPIAKPCLGAGDQKLRVTDVEPWPRNGKLPSTADYRVKLRLSTRCDWVAGAP
jgi:hypothetical protein